MLGKRWLVPVQTLDYMTNSRATFGDDSDSDENHTTTTYNDNESEVYEPKPIGGDNDDDEDELDKFMAGIEVCCQSCTLALCSKVNPVSSSVIYTDPLQIERACKD